MKRLGTLLAVVVAIIAATVTTSHAPGYAQGVTPAVTEIQLSQGLNPGEVVVSWDAVPAATHYRIGYVNMETDYPLATASATGDWIEAFLYADVDARNFTVSGGRVQYTLRRLEQGVRHAVTVLASSNHVNTRDRFDSEFVWPTNPRWQRIEVADHGGACPSVAPAPTPPPNSCLSDGTCLPIRAIGSVSGTGDSTQHVFNLSAGLYRFTLSGDGLVSADMVSTSPDRDIFYFDFVSSSGARSTEELITVDPDDAGPYILEIDAGSTEWEFSIVQVGS